MAEVFRIGGDAKWAVEPTADIIGGKAMSLYTMSKLGLPVPPAIVIPCKATFEYQKNPGMLADLRVAVENGLSWIEKTMGRSCLFSVRSGAPISMPGMMDTVLNVGLNNDSAPTFNKILGQRAMWDSYRRLLQMYGTVVLGYDSKDFETTIDAAKKMHKANTDAELSWGALRDLVDLWSNPKTASVELHNLRNASVTDQVLAAAGAVFGSWNSERAIEYRKLNAIPDTLGTAVTIQAMVYGNLNYKSGSGVLFTRNPSTGEPTIMAEYLANAQGEDVVSGARTPESLKLDLDTHYAEAWKNNLCGVVVALEVHHRDMMDVEFTVENEKLYILQSRRGKRTPRAAVKIAALLIHEGLIKPEELKNGYLTKKDIGLACGAVITDKGDAKLVAKGVPASGGVVAGIAVIGSDNAVEMSSKTPVILLAEETTPDDIKGMAASAGILTEVGGTTSHAAVVSRAMNKTCVVGIEKVMAHQGSWLVINGDTGEVWSDPKKTMKIDSGGTTAIQELAQAIAAASNRTVLMDELVPYNGPVAVRVVDIMLRPDTVKALMAFKPKEVLLDLRAPDEFMHKDDAVAWALLRPHTLDVAHSFLAYGLTKGLVGAGCQVTVAGGDDALLKDLASGVHRIKTAKTVADLMGDVPLTVSQEFIDTVMGGKETYEAVLEKLGVKPKLFLAPSTPYAVVLEALA